MTCSFFPVFTVFSSFLEEDLHEITLNANTPMILKAIIFLYIILIFYKNSVSFPVFPALTPLGVSVKVQASL